MQIWVLPLYQAPCLELHRAQNGGQVRTIFLLFISVIIAGLLAYALGWGVIFFELYFVDLAQHPLANLLGPATAILIWILLTCTSMWYLWGGPQADRETRDYLKNRGSKP